MKRELKRIEKELGEICDTSEPGVKVRRKRASRSKYGDIGAMVEKAKEGARAHAKLKEAGMKEPQPMWERFDERELLDAVDLEAKEHPSGALLLVSRVRKRTTLSKERFDMAALRLVQRYGEPGATDAVILHYHDYPASLSQEERDEMVRDKEGTYYIGIARARVGGLRKASGGNGHDRAHSRRRDGRERGSGGGSSRVSVLAKPAVRVSRGSVLGRHSSPV